MTASVFSPNPPQCIVFRCFVAAAAAVVVVVVVVVVVWFVFVPNQIPTQQRERSLAPKPRRPHIPSNNIGVGVDGRHHGHSKLFFSLPHTPSHPPPLVLSLPYTNPGSALTQVKAVAALSTHSSSTEKRFGG